MTTTVAQDWSIAVVWFRRDLRVMDHPALAEAVVRARMVVPLFVEDPRLSGSSTAPARAWFLQRSLAELDASLRARGSGLVVRDGPPERVVAEVARAAGADVVLASRDVTPFSHRRDQAVDSALKADGRQLLLRSGLLLAEPEAMLTTSSTSYSVFTPFWRALQHASRRSLRDAPESVSSPPMVRDGHMARLQELAVASRPLEGLPIPGEAAAVERLQDWVAAGLAAYGEDRDGLSGDATSHLGADLHFGTLSPLQIESAAMAANVDATPFVRQLAWREFYHHQLFGLRAARDHPDSPLTAAFRRESDDPEGVAAWRGGRTGVPVVDAAMRQLSATGWISNRARLVVASFLTRHLLMDYRVGERHFMRHLIDGDIANNRGGWRWTAGVGADPQPWFRIFNPVLQGKRFDPHGSWVRRWLPELLAVPDRYIHAPWEMPASSAAEVGVRIGATYPHPIVDLAAGRQRALAAFRAAAGRD